MRYLIISYHDINLKPLKTLLRTKDFMDDPDLSVTMVQVPAL